MLKFMKNSIKTVMIAIAVTAGVGILWFASHSTHKTTVKNYAMAGIVISVNPGAHTANIHNDNIPGFMQAMEMEYRIDDAAVLKQLKRGDNVRATLVSDGRNTWILKNIVIQPSH